MILYHHPPFFSMVNLPLSYHFAIFRRFLHHLSHHKHILCVTRPLYILILWQKIHIPFTLAYFRCFPAANLLVFSCHPTLPSTSFPPDFALPKMLFALSSLWMIIYSHETNIWIFMRFVFWRTRSRLPLGRATLQRSKRIFFSLSLHNSPCEISLSPCIRYI